MTIKHFYYLIVYVCYATIIMLNMILRVCVRTLYQMLSKYLNNKMVISVLTSNRMIKQQNALAFCKTRPRRRCNKG